jgi:bifunctional non-homologous end joining protein LigD
MLAYAAPGPFDSERHLFEIKWDGARCLLFLQGGAIRLQNRRLEAITPRYPELAAGLPRQLAARDAILDGELVALKDGQPSFARLQQREQVADPFKISLLSRSVPVTYVAFDILWLNGGQVTAQPLLARKEMLAGIVRETPQLIVSRFVRERGAAYFREVVSRGLEGVMAKTVAGPYLMGRRSRLWLKIKPRQEKVCTVIGFTRDTGARAATLGALLVATREGAAWRYRGKVGSGFGSVALEELAARLRDLETPGPPLPQPPRVRGVHWVRPRLRVRVSFQEETGRGHFRAPVFEGMADNDQGVLL